MIARDPRAPFSLGLRFYFGTKSNVVPKAWMHIVPGSEKVIAIRMRDGPSAHGQSIA